MDDMKQLLSDLKEPTRTLRDAIPETWGAFGALHREAVRDGALSARHKELMAVAIAVATGCEGCIGYHTKAAVRHGASAEEMAETLGVTLLMAGGPASVHGPVAWAAYHELAG
jgi:AhpD family alkylhydroperoxidase